MASSNFNLRGLSPETMISLKKEARRLRMSVNALVLKMIEGELGFASEKLMYHDLDHLAGSWSSVEEATFEENTQLSGKLSKAKLDKVPDLTLADPLKELIDPKKTALAILECLQNNDPEGVMEMIAIYLEAKNKTALRKGVALPKSTMYSALKHRNPTIKTLAKLMSTR